jgi:ADP-ribose pyrophosphatase YjhB (NUDIX family)|tara:strand:+ start:11491 stop:11898 length:408 start_codon:yes stop_codon:yes gene_type:complete
MRSDLVEVTTHDLMKVITLAVITEGKLLLVKKLDSWIIPGGKIKSGESHGECLVRELREELQTEIVIRDFYGRFEGITPISKRQACVSVYFGTINGVINPSAEISDARLIRNFRDYNLAEISKKIVESFKSNGYL